MPSAFNELDSTFLLPLLVHAASKVEFLQERVSSGLRALGALPGVGPVGPIDFVLEFLWREMVIIAHPSDILCGLQPAALAAQVLAPSWGRGFLVFVPPQTDEPLVPPTAQTLVEVQGFLGPPGLDEHRLAGLEEKAFGLSDERAGHQARESDEEGTTGDHKRVLDLQAPQEDRKTHCCPQEGHIVFATVAGLGLVGGAVQALSGCRPTILGSCLCVHMPGRCGPNFPCASQTGLLKLNEPRAQ